VRAPGTLWVIQDWDDFGERVNGQPQPEGVCLAAQPRANLVQLHVRQLEMMEPALVEGCAMLTGPREPSRDRGGTMAEHSYRRRDIKPFSKRSEHFRNPMGCRFEAIERRIGAGAEGGSACLTPEGLDTFSLPVHTITHQSMDLRIGNLIVRAGSVRAGKSVCGNPLGGAPTAFALAPRRNRKGEGRG
jgi:hypothetical protein